MANAKTPKFIQIASTELAVVALDENGDVWIYTFRNIGGGTEQWRKLAPRK
jgi:hypothetical protein